MRKVKRLLKENWIPIVAGIFLTKWAVDYAYQMRGYDAIGSEWVVLPFTIFILTADARTQKSRDPYIPANGARSQFMKVTSIWILQKVRFAKIV